MGLDYTFRLSATAKASAETLQSFLKSVEAEALSMGFQPTCVFSATFDTQEQRDFARRIRVLAPITDKKLQGVVLPREGQVSNLDSVEGYARVFPEQAVVLVVTNERQIEDVFAFARYPEAIEDVNGKPILKMPCGRGWHFAGKIQSPDPRYRKIVKRFADAGYLVTENDEYYRTAK